MRRLTLEISDAVHERIHELKRKTGAASMTEVFRRALALYETAVDLDGDGSKLLAQSESGKIRQIVVP